MPLTASEQYDANKQKDRGRNEEIKRELQAMAKSRWWHLGQRDPVARFTWWLVVVTTVLVIATGATISVLIRTDETSRLRDRAFVYFGDPLRAFYPSEKPRYLSAGITVFNAGNMPARHTVIQYACPDALYDTTTEPFRLAEWQNAEVGSVIGPKNNFGLQGCNIPIATFFAAQWSKDANGAPKKPEREIFYLVKVTYLDGFSDETRVTQMSRSFRFDEDGGQSLAFVRNHNCSDDDCPKEK